MESNRKKSRSDGKRILVTGGAGYIGSHTVIELTKAGHHVIIVDNLDNSSSECVRRVEKLLDCRLDFHLVDLCNYDALRLVFNKCGPLDAVIHFAGLKAVGESVKVPLAYYDNNLVGTINLLRVMDEFQVHNFIFSSSATVYGEQKTMPVAETAPTSALNPYGRTKLMIEEILQDLAISDSKWKIIVLRYFNPVGADQSGTIGEDPNGVPNNLMPFVCQVAVGKREFLSVFGNDFPTKDGTGVRDYIHVVDLARGHVSALEEGVYNLLQKTDAVTFPKGNIDYFNLGTGVGYSVLEMVAALERACGQKIPYKIVARRSGDVPGGVVVADVRKAKNLLKWSALFDLQRMTEDSWRWQKGNPNGFKAA